MKHKSFIAILLGLGLSAGGIVLAQDATGEIPPQVVTDPGVEAVREAQEMTPPRPKKTSPENELRKIAREKGWREGWDRDKKRFISIVSTEINCKNPATDETFFIKREAAARRANLMAKKDIIEFINKTMSASDCLTIPGSNLREKFDAEMRAYEAKVLEEKEKLAKILEQYNRAEAAELRGTTISDRLDDLLVAVIKKLDEDYDASAKDEKLKAQLAEAKKNLEEQKAAYQKILKEAEAARGTVTQENYTTSETYASMPLYGATVLMQLEGFDKNYELAMIVVWSSTLERAARAIVTGEPFKLKPKADGCSLSEWIEKQDLSSMIGPRTFMDKDGSRWFLGISATKYDDDMGASKKTAAKLTAEELASSMTAFSLMGDVESYKKAQQMVNTTENASGEEVDKAAQTLDAKISQTLNNITIRGMQKVDSDVTTHPIANRDMYVVVYGIDSTSAEDALEMEKENYATKIQQERYQTVERGRKAANQAAVEAAKNRKDDFNKGVSEQSKALNEELQKRENEKKQNSGTRIQPSTPAKDPTKPNDPTRGIFGGDTDVDDDF